MKKELREYLVSIGMRSAATEQQAWAYYRSLTGENYTRAREIRGTRQPASGGGNDDGESEADADGQRSDPPASAPQQRSAPAASPLTPEQIGQIARDAVEQERQQQAEVRSEVSALFEEGEFPEIRTRALGENWTVHETATALLAAQRRARSEPVGAGAIHIRGGNASVATLQAAMLVRSGVALDNSAFANTNSARAMNLPSWMRRDINHEERQQVMDEAHLLGPQSMVDLCRHSLAAAGRNIPNHRDEMIRAAFETGSLEAIYTTNVNARLLASYSEAEDTTVGWTSSFDFENFKENELATMGKMGRLTRHGRKKTADHMDRGAEMEPMKIFRYDGQYCLDEIDIINNRLGNPESDSPEEMGLSARQTEIDLVYAVLLQNDNLIKDDTALFDGVNDFTGSGSVLEVLALERAITAMKDQRQRGRPLNLKPAYLLVAPHLEFHAERIVSSGTLLNLAAGASNLQGGDNVVSKKQIKVVADTRLGTQGVVDPFSNTQIDGNNNQWFLSAEPGVGGAKTIAKGYRTGTGRMPTVRSYNMTKGTWGIGWDINHDVGAKAIDRCAMSRHGSDQ